MPAKHVFDYRKRGNTTADKEKKRNTRIKIWNIRYSNNYSDTCPLRVKITVGFCDHFHYTGKYSESGAANNICNIRYKTLIKIFAVYHNGSNCDYNFIIKKFTEELK